MKKEDNEGIAGKQEFKTKAKKKKKKGGGTRKKTRRNRTWREEAT